MSIIAESFPGENLEAGEISKVRQKKRSEHVKSFRLKF